MSTEGEITGAMERLHISRECAETVEYIGDGVYTWFDGTYLWLGTLEGERIALDREAYNGLVTIAKAAGIA